MKHATRWGWALGLSLISCGLWACERTRVDALHGGQAELLEASSSDGTWIWQDVPGARCANGSQTGFAMNLMHESNQLMVFFEGGGACSDALQCYIEQTAAHIVDGYTQATFENDALELPALNKQTIMRRDEPQNPFLGMNWAYIPYCTGDIHAGTQIVNYPMAGRSTYHVGGLNAALYFKRLASNLSQVNHVWLVGDSAGGYGAVLNRDRAQSSFPQARIDLLDDSGIAFKGFDEPISWQVQLPLDCADCTNDFAALLLYFSQTYPQMRIGFTSYSIDSTLPYYLGLSASAFSNDLQSFIAENMTQTNLQSFVVNGSSHVVLQNPNASSQGTRLISWVNAMVADDPNWQTKISF